MGILQRGGKVRTAVIPNRRKKAIQDEVRKHVEAGSALYTDALLSYEGLAGDFAHQVIDHASTLMVAFTRTGLRISGAC
jgi:transposase-like protein